MADATAEFFGNLAGEGRQELLGKVKGRARFDLTHGDGAEHWLVTIDRGDVGISRGKGAADCTIGTEKAFFERLIRGEDNATAAVLRGAIVCGGDVELLLAVQRVFPGPADRKQSGQAASVSG